MILFGLGLGALFTGVIAAFGADFVYGVYHAGTRSSDLEAPMWIVYLAIPLGSSLMCYPLPAGCLAVLRAWRAAAPRRRACRRLETRRGTRAGSHRACVHRRRPHERVPDPAAARHCRLAFASKFGLVQIGGGLRTSLVFALLLSLMLTSMPISISLGLTVLTFMFTLTEVPIASVAMKLFTGIENFEIMAIPFFILAGNFLTHGGVARRMIKFATSLVGHWHGGLGLAAVLACALFAAVSGSSPATVVAIGSVVMPAMVAQGFPARFGAGVVTTSGALGILIPPSIAMVLYAVSTNTSVGKLFIAGIVPGIMLATMLGLTTWYRARKFGYPRMRAVQRQGKAGGVPRIGVGPAADRDRDRRHLHRHLHAHRGRGDERGVCVLHRRVRVQGPAPEGRAAGAAVFGELERDAALHHHQRGAVLLRHVEREHPAGDGRLDGGARFRLDRVPAHRQHRPAAAGNLMEPSSIILIMAPILFPVAMKLGIDPIHFGILITVNMEVGLCHPPVGLNLYVASGIAKMGITELTIAVWPWLLTMLVFLGIVTYWPGFAVPASPAGNDVINRDIRILNYPGGCLATQLFAMSHQ